MSDTNQTSTGFRREYRIIERSNGEFLGQSRSLNNGQVYQDWMCPYHPDTPRSTLAQAKADLDSYIARINGLEIARIHPYQPPDATTSA